MLSKPPPSKLKDLDLVIRNGVVYDGTGTPPVKCDIGITQKKIMAMGTIPELPRVPYIDAGSLVVVPGLIDVHSHSDWTIVVDNRADSKIRQGVTTEVIGNCGTSGAPLYGACKAHLEKVWSPYNIKPAWTHFSEYVDHLVSNGLALNIVPLVGHGNIRAAVMGYHNRLPTHKESAAMERILEQCLLAGAFGLSTGLVYPPGLYAQTHELVDLGKVVSRFGGLYATHMRYENGRIIEAIEEALTIGKEAAVPVQISHFKIMGQENWKKAGQAFALIEDGIAGGIDVSCDSYPYTAASTGLDALLPSRVYEGGDAKELSRLRDDIARKTIIQELKEKPGWDRITISTVNSEKNRHCQGRTIAELARVKGTAPEEFVCNLLLEEELQVEAIFNLMDEGLLKRILSKEYVMVGSDSSAKAKSGRLSTGKPHPRTYGTFPRMLGMYVQNGVVTLAEALKKMCALPAAKLGICKRGIIKEENYADIVILNPREIADTATYDDPHNYPRGIDWVIVNGRIAVERGVPTGILAGEVLNPNCAIDVDGEC